MDKNVHLICKTGEKIVVPHKDYNDSEMLKDGKYDDYHFPAEIAKRLAKLYARSLINKKGYNGQEL